MHLYLANELSTSACKKKMVCIIEYKANMAHVMSNIRIKVKFSGHHSTYIASEGFYWNEMIVYYIIPIEKSMKPVNLEFNSFFKCYLTQ